jgi:hypothetical protein
MMHKHTRITRPGKYEGEPLLTALVAERYNDFDEEFTTYAGWYGKVNLGRYGVHYYFEGEQGFFEEINASVYHAAAQSAAEQEALDEQLAEAEANAIKCAINLTNLPCRSCASLLINGCPVHEAGCPVENAYVRAVQRVRQIEMMQ